MCDSFSTRIERAEKLNSQLLSDHSSYHNQKERMAHVGFLLEVAIFGGVISTKNWPPTWIPDITFSAQIIAFSAFTLIWLFIHIFIRWQLRNRRWAALQYAGVLRAARKWVVEPPTPEDLQPYKIDHPIETNKLGVLFDYIIPWPKARIRSDLGMEGFPKCIVDGVKEQDNEGTGAVFAESLLTFGSIFIYLGVLFRTFFGQ